MVFISRMLMVNKLYIFLILKQFLHLTSQSQMKNRHFLNWMDEQKNPSSFRE